MSEGRTPAESVFERLRELIANGESLSTAEGLRDLVRGMNATGLSGTLSSSYLNEITIQIGRISRTRKAYRSNTLSRSQFEREMSAIDSALLEIIDNLERLSPAQLPVAERPVDLSPGSNAVLEKILGPASHLKSLSWLHQGLACARSVCRVVGPSGIGSGFLIQNGLMLTNHHVLQTRDDALRAEIELNFEEDGRGNVKDVSRYRLDPSLFVTDEALDCTVVKVVEGKSPVDLQEWGALVLAEQAKIELGDHVAIIQHPNGGVKQICLTENRVVNLLGDRVQYTTDTMPGSSGSPVFDGRWHVVALHHQGGNLVKGPRGGHIFANQGVRISSILANDKIRSLVR